MRFLIVLVLVATSCQRQWNRCSYDQQDKAVTCREFNTAEDVSDVAEYIRGKPEADRIEIKNSDLDLLPDDFFASNKFTTMIFWSCEMREMPYRLINSAGGCGKLERLGLIWSYIRNKTLPAGGFQQCTQLQVLVLENNGIQAISPDAFKGLFNLTGLSLQRNKISLLEKGTFQDQHKLIELDLANNQLETLEEGLFDPISNTIEKLYLTGNPFHCNCSLQWLKEWRQQQSARKPNSDFQKTMSSIRCSAPVFVKFDDPFCSKTKQPQTECKPKQVASQLTELLTTLLEQAYSTPHQGCPIEQVLSKLQSALKSNVTDSASTNTTQ